MSDTFRAAVFVTLSGGFQDAYTYISRGQVFANAQTGNIVLLSAALLRGDWAVCLKYLIPILSFVLGTMAAEFIHIRFRNFRQLHWRQLVLLQEIVFLCAAFNKFLNVREFSLVDEFSGQCWIQTVNTEHQYFVC